MAVAAVARSGRPRRSLDGQGERHARDGRAGRAYSRLDLRHRRRDAAGPPPPPAGRGEPLRGRISWASSSSSIPWRASRTASRWRWSRPPRRRAASRPAHHDRRADLGQHRHRARLRLRRQGLPAGPHHAGEHVARAPQDAEALRRRARADPVAARHAGRRSPPPAAPGERPDAFMLHSSRTPPTRQSTAHHRRGDLARHRRRPRRPRRRRRHRRHAHRLRPGAEAAPAGP